VQAEPSNAHMDEKELWRRQSSGWLLDARQLIPLVVYGITHFWMKSIHPLGAARASGFSHIQFEVKVSLGNRVLRVVPSTPSPSVRFVTSLTAVVKA
jgi:hypothetical protein